MKRLLIYFFGWKGLIVLASFLATFFIPFNHQYTFKYIYTNFIPYHIFVWGNFDGFHYLTIAKNGYSAFLHPFMPLYPIFISYLSHATHIHSLYCALFISHAAFFLSLLLVTKLLIIDTYKRLTSYVLLSIFLFPTSLFYGAAYNDSLFFLFALLCMVLARKQKYFLSGLAGMFAVLTRINGLALFPFILAEYLFHNQTISNSWKAILIKKTYIRPFASLKKTLTVIASSLLIPFSFIGYLLYTQIKFGNWNLVFSSMQNWNQDKIIFPLQVIFRYMRILFYFPYTKLEYWVAVGELTAFFLYITLLIISFKRIRISYWLFFLCSILIPSLTGTFQGMPRYGLHIYPMFLTIAFLFKKFPKIIKIMLIFISIVLLILYSAYFTRGYFVA